MGKPRGLLRPLEILFVDQRMVDDPNMILYLIVLIIYRPTPIDSECTPTPKKWIEVEFFILIGIKLLRIKMEKGDLIRYPNQVMPQFPSNDNREVETEQEPEQTPIQEQLRRSAMLREKTLKFHLEVGKKHVLI
ncbi:hypothetical protein RF11_13192 [Thelohanellus kitauei]|uniref:Uncharacterized protein n=1 Tax=Thelohanellus kitauei TaxID=669202 RepID=A0A0C2JBT6_THEKT|nr:hypothetical protein RF11_13192 [Thelohanellus kitauei]